MRLSRTTKAHLYILSLALYYLVFVLAYSGLSRLESIDSFSDLASVENIESPAYKARYIAAVLIVLFQAFHGFHGFSQSLYLYFASSFFLLSFFLSASSGNIILGASVLVAAFSAIAIAKTLHFLKTYNRFLLAILLLIFTAPTLLAIYTNNFDFIYNSFYGRPRLLLGFAHPKEAAGTLLFIYMVAIAWFRTEIHKPRSSRAPSNYLLLISSAPIVFLLIGSRTTALISLGFWLASLLPRLKSYRLRVSCMFILIFCILAIFCMLIISHPDSLYNFVNEVASNRLDLWGEYLDGSINLGKSGSGIASALDNSYLNIWFDATPVGLICFLTPLLLLLVLLFRRDQIFTDSPRYRYFSSSIFLLFILLAGITDSGLTSPTSLNFVSAWSLFLFSSSIPASSIEKVSF